MRIQRTIPPAAAPISWKDAVSGFSGLFSGRRHLRTLERELRDYFGVRHVFLVSSGKAALTIILRSLKTLSPGKNEALIPAYTCFSVPSAVVKAGLRASLCDVDASTYDLDRTLMGDAVSDDTLCVIPTHLFGIPADVEGVKSFCRDKGIFVIEDAAQAMGAVSRGRRLGTLGDAGFFSLGRGKNLTCGSGGIIITDSDPIAGAIQKEYSRIKSAGALESVRTLLYAIILKIFTHPALFWFPSGLPFLKLGETVFHEDFKIRKLSGVQAALLTGWQKRLETANRRRGDNARFFCDSLGLKAWKGRPLPVLRLPLLVRDKQTRDRLLSAARREGLGISRMYPSPVDEIEEIRNWFRGRTFPRSKDIAERIVTIPTHHLLSGEDRSRIVSLIRKTAPLDFPSGSEGSSPRVSVA
jgi:perosamine synthetase